MVALLWCGGGVFGGGGGVCVVGVVNNNNNTHHPIPYLINAHDDSLPSPLTRVAQNQRR